MTSTKSADNHNPKELGCVFISRYGCMTHTPCPTAIALMMSDLDKITRSNRFQRNPAPVKQRLSRRKRIINTLI